MRSLITLMLVGAALVACGDDDSGNPTAATSPAATTAPTTAAFPQDLAGTWTMRLPVSEVEDAPNEFNEAAPVWELKILPDGGVDGAPSFTLANEGTGAIASPALSVAGDRITLTDADEECQGRPLEKVYAYALAGDELTLTAADVPCAEGDVINTLITARPWGRVQ